MRVIANVPDPDITGVEAQRRAKLTDAAQQFEAMMLQQMLKPMKEGEDSWGGEESDSGSDTLSSFGTEAFAKAISERGGFGIAKQVISQVEREHQRTSGKKMAGY